MEFQCIENNFHLIFTKSRSRFILYYKKKYLFKFIKLNTLFLLLNYVFLKFYHYYYYPLLIVKESKTGDRS